MRGAKRRSNPCRHERRLDCFAALAMTESAFATVNNIEHMAILNETMSRNKRDFITSDEYHSSHGCPRIGVARDPAPDRAAGVRARGDAVELSPRRARPVAQPVGDQSSNPRTGRTVRHETVRARRALGAAHRRRRTLSGESLPRAGDVAGCRPRHVAATPRRDTRTLDQFTAVLHVGRIVAGVVGFQAASSRSDAADRSHPSICRLQFVARRRRHPLRPRAFDRAEIRTAGDGEGLAGLRAGAGQTGVCEHRKICRARC